MISSQQHQQSFEDGGENSSKQQLKVSNTSSNSNGNKRLISGGANKQQSQPVNKKLCTNMAKSTAAAIRYEENSLKLSLICKSPASVSFENNRPNNNVNNSRPIVKAVANQSPNQNEQKPNSSNVKTLKQKLYDLYLEECKKSSSSFKSLNFGTNLLKKLLKRESTRYNYLVLNLYEMNKGYSMGFHIQEANNDSNNNLTKGKDAAAVAAAVTCLNSIETDLISYDETELLFYINCGEIPPILIDLVDRLGVNLFYDGCIIAEIRDYRRSQRKATIEPPSPIDEEPPELSHLLLQSSTQTLVADLNSMCSGSGQQPGGGHIWTQDDKNSLESQLLVATQPSLCLEPNPRVSIARSSVVRGSGAFTAERRLKRFALRYSEAYRRRASAHNYALPYPFRIAKLRRDLQQQHQQQFCSSSSSSSSSSSNPNTPTTANSLSSSSGHAAFSRISGLLASALNYSSHTLTKIPNRIELSDLPSEETIFVKKLSRKPPPLPPTSLIDLKNKQNPSNNESTMVAIEEVLLEAVDKQIKNNYSRLLIKQRASDGVYFCELYLKPVTSENGEFDDFFRLGLASDVERYVQQYVKIFTEEGRKAVSIRHNLLEKSSTSTIDSSSMQFQASNSALKKPTNNSLCLTGAPFHSLFPPSIQFEFKDKQVHAYQTFLLAQQAQQKAAQQQQQQQLEQAKQQQQLMINKQIQQQQQQQPTTIIISDKLSTATTNNMNQTATTTTPTTPIPTQQNHHIIVNNPSMTSSSNVNKNVNNVNGNSEHGNGNHTNHNHSQNSSVVSTPPTPQHHLIHNHSQSTLVAAAAAATTPSAQPMPLVNASPRVYANIQPAKAEINIAPKTTTTTTTTQILSNPAPKLIKPHPPTDPASSQNNGGGQIPSLMSLNLAPHQSVDSPTTNNTSTPVYQQQQQQQQNGVHSLIPISNNTNNQNNVVLPNSGNATNGNYIQIYVPKLMSTAGANQSRPAPTNLVVQNQQTATTPTKALGGKPAARKGSMTTTTTTAVSTATSANNNRKRTQSITTSPTTTATPGTVNIAPRFVAAATASNSNTTPPKIVNALNLNQLLRQQQHQHQQQQQQQLKDNRANNSNPTPLILTINSEGMTAAAALAAVNFNNSHHANNNHGPTSASNSPMKTATVQYTPIAQKTTTTPVKILNEIRLNNESSKNVMGATYLLSSSSSSSSSNSSTDLRGDSSTASATSSTLTRLMDIKSSGLDRR